MIGARRWAWGGGAMRGCERLAGPGWPVGPALTLILAGLGVAIWLVGGLVLVVVCLVPLTLALALSPPLALVLPPLVLACRSWTGWHWRWLCRPWSFVRPWSWLCRSWLRWPWLCWWWLR